MAKKESVVMSLRLHPETRKALEKIGKRQTRSLSNILVIAVNEFIERETPNGQKK